MNNIIIALAKGRLLSPTINLLQEAGISCSILHSDTRKLILKNDTARITYILAKSNDIPYFVKSGVADIGIVGKDILLEVDKSHHEIDELADLHIGKCRMVLAGKAELKGKLDTIKDLKVASKYPNIAKQYFSKKNKDVEIIALSGSVELAPLVGLSDVIFEIVESGKTLSDNNLSILEDVLDLSARLIVNRESLKKEYDRIMEIVHRITKTLI